jgi:hypothetical protein
MHQNYFNEQDVLVILVSSMRQNGTFTTQYLIYCYLSFAAHISNRTP